MQDNIGQEIKESDLNGLLSNRVFPISVGQCDFTTLASECLNDLIVRQINR
jgi:hypothetical protein